MSVAAESSMVAEPTKPLLTIREMAEYLDMSRSTFQRIARTPGFPVFRTGRVVKYPWKAVVDFITQAAKEGRDLRATDRRRKK